MAAKRKKKAPPVKRPQKRAKFARALRPTQPTQTIVLDDANSALERKVAGLQATTDNLVAENKALKDKQAAADALQREAEREAKHFKTITEAVSTAVSAAVPNAVTVALKERGLTPK